MAKKVEHIQVSLSSDTVETLSKIAKLRQLTPIQVAQEILSLNLRAQKRLLASFGYSSAAHENKQTRKQPIKKK